jgi:hypothetical protein
MMKRISGVMLSIWLLVSAWPALAEDEGPVLDQVIFQVSAQEWAKTDTALVHVSIDAALSESNLAAMREQIMGNLAKIAKADWQITQFQRSKDRSGLEQLKVRAQARVPEQALTKINSQAEAVSKPGTTYRVDDVDFTPSLPEMEMVNTKVRQKIYQQINAEIAQLNKDFAGKQYTVHQIDFTGMGFPVGKAKQERADMQLMVQGAPVALSVGNKVVLSAVVVVAAKRVE